MPVVFDRNTFDEREILRAIKPNKSLASQIPGLMNRVSDFVSNPDKVSLYSYQRMLETDETVGAAVDMLIRSIVGRLGEYQHPSDEITDFIHAAFDAMKGTMHGMAREVLTAKWAGFSVSEKVFGLGTYEGRPVVAWQRIDTLPPATMAFEVDNTGQITPNGVLQFNKTIIATSAYLLQNIRAQESQAKYGNDLWPKRIGVTTNDFVRIPRAKVIHFPTGSPSFGNPYGRTPLRRAYKSWVMKDVVLRMLLTALDRKGTPLTWATAPDGQVPVHDALGNQVLVDDVPQQESAQVALARALKNIHQESVLVTGPELDGYKLESLGYGEAGKEFIEALSYLNRAITRSMLLPSLLLEEGDRSGSLALGKSHSDTFATVVQSELDDLCAVLIDELIRDIIVLNFGEQTDGYGEFLPVPPSAEELQVLSEMFASLIENGILMPGLIDDWQLIRNRLGLPADEEIFESGEQLRDDLDDDDDGDEPAADSGAERKAQLAARRERRRNRDRIVRLLPTRRYAA